MQIFANKTLICENLLFICENLREIKQIVIKIFLLYLWNPNRKRLFTCINNILIFNIMRQVQVIRADLDEIVFENREKQYGGYVLRKNYHKYLVFAMLIMVSATALGVVVPYIYAKIQQVRAANEEKQVILTLEDLPKTPEKEKPADVLSPPPPPPPPQIETPPAATAPIEQIAIKTPVPKPPDDVAIEETIHSVDEAENKAISNVDKDGEKTSNENAPILPKGEPEGKGKEPIVIQEPPQPEKPQVETPAPKEPQEPKPDVFIALSKQPKEVNLNDIQKLIGYPAVAIEGNLEDNIVFRVLIDENGNYVRHITPKKGHPIFIKAIEEHISKVKFTPALQGKNPIKFWVNVPFVFKLQ